MGADSIMLWMVPYYQVARFGASKLVRRRTVLVMHALHRPESAVALGQMYRDAGFSDGACYNSYVSSDQAAGVFANEGVQGISLTGPGRAGAATGEIARRHPQKVALELDGSDPLILVCTDDLIGTVQAVIATGLDNREQACNGTKRVIVVDDLCEALPERLAVVMRATQPDETTILGPHSSLTAAENVRDQVEWVVATGVTLALGRQRDGASFPPIVFTWVRLEMDAYVEEFFGPVAMVFEGFRRGQGRRPGQRHDLCPARVPVHQPRRAIVRCGGQGRGRNDRRQLRRSRQPEVAIRCGQAAPNVAGSGAAGRGRLVNKKLIGFGA